MQTTSACGQMVTFRVSATINGQTIKYTRESSGTTSYAATARWSGMTTEDTTVALKMISSKDMESTPTMMEAWLSARGTRISNTASECTLTDMAIVSTLPGTWERKLRL